MENPEDGPICYDCTDTTYTFKGKLLAVVIVLAFTVPALINFFFFGNKP